VTGGMAGNKTKTTGDQTNKDKQTRTRAKTQHKEWPSGHSCLAMKIEAKPPRQSSPSWQLENKPTKRARGPPMWLLQFHQGEKVMSIFVVYESYENLMLGNQ